MTSDESGAVKVDAGAGAYIEALGPIDHGMVVVLREAIDFDEDDDARMDRHAEMVKELARACGHTDFTLLIIDPSSAIELLDVEQMRAAGWYQSPGFQVTVLPTRPMLESESEADR